MLIEPNPDLPDDDEIPALPKRRMQPDTEMDMTPMIDCTFLLLVFFVVGAKLDPDAVVQLPPARYGAGVDPARSTIITIAQESDTSEPQIFLADGDKGAPLEGDAEAQANQVKAAVEAGLLAGRLNVLIKAERRVKHRDVSRVATAASQFEGITLNVAVMEKGADE